MYIHTYVAIITSPLPLTTFPTPPRLFDSEPSLPSRLYSLGKAFLSMEEAPSALGRSFLWDLPYAERGAPKIPDVCIIRRVGNGYAKTLGHPGAPYDILIAYLKSLHSSLPRAATVTERWIFHQFTSFIVLTLREILRPKTPYCTGQDS